MSTVSLSPQEAIARELIIERVAAAHHAHHAHHAPKRAGRIRRHVRAALFLRSLAERLDPPSERPAAAGVAAVQPHAGSPRPWSAERRPTVRRAPHRHS